MRRPTRDLAPGHRSFPAILVGHGFIDRNRHDLLQGEPMATTPLQQLAQHGQSVWLDYLSRKFIHEGELEALVGEGVVGVTSNPTIFQGAIAEGDAYDDQIRELVSAGTTEPKDIFIAVAADDIQDACDAFRPAWDEGRGKDGWVSLEVDPNLAHDTQG